MDASKPKWVNPNDIKYGVNSLRLGSLHIMVNHSQIKKITLYDIPYGGLNNKWVNPIFNIIGVNSLRLWGLHIFDQNRFFSINGRSSAFGPIIYQDRNVKTNPSLISALIELFTLLFLSLSVFHIDVY